MNQHHYSAGGSAPRRCASAAAGPVVHDAPWLDGTGGAAFIVGLLISPVFARVLPFEWDGQVAAFIMQANRWRAGTALMQAQSPEAWRGLLDDFNLVKSNQAALAVCRTAAGKPKKSWLC